MVKILINIQLFCEMPEQCNGIDMTAFDERHKSLCGIIPALKWFHIILMTLSERLISVSLIK